MFPDFSSLPQFAQVVIYASLGLGLAFVYLIGHAGFKQGMKSTPSETTAQVAALVIDPIPLKLATQAIEALNMSIIGQTMAIKEQTNSVKEVSHEVDELKKEMYGLRIAFEMFIRSR